MRSVADGQSQNSFTNTSMRYLGGSNAYASDLVNSRPGKLIRNNGSYYVHILFYPKLQNKCKHTCYENLNKYNNS